MNGLNTFIEKAVRFQKLTTPEQLAEAKAITSQGHAESLLDALLKLGILSEDQTGRLRELYEKNRGRLERGRPKPAPAAKAPAAVASAGSEQASEVPDSGGVSAAASDKPDIEFDADRISSFRKLDDYLGYAREIGASDLHITVGAPPVVRKYGQLRVLPREPLTADETERLLFDALTDDQKIRVREELALDACNAIEGQGRYRSCVLKQRLGWDGAFRVIDNKVPSFEKLELPEDLRRLTEYRQGLVLITGPRGCGKSTTLAALVQVVNENRDEHIITIEDPIEYEFVPARCQITQREVGAHTETFAAALRAALREDPDVIMIGELRDVETMSLAITAAETGHLVFSTLHTTSAARTIDRVLDVFPPDEASQVRSMVSESLRGIICQQLIPRKDGSGVAMAIEVLFNTVAVANLIRERKLFQLPSLMLTGKKQGMRLLDNSLWELLDRGVIAGCDAFFAADDKSRFLRWAPGIESLDSEA